MDRGFFSSPRTSSPNGIYLPRCGQVSFILRETPVDNSEIKALNDASIINTYGERKLAFVRGDGMFLWDAGGGRYLDFFAGIAVTNLGHCHPAVADAVCQQARQLDHVSNLYYMEPQARLAEQLSRHSFADRWFFANCGATANEAAIKLARRYWSQQGAPKPEIITAEQSFHGRTIATVTATGQPRFQEGFEPLLPGIRYVPYNDLDALRAAITPESGAVMLELIQGEGGVRTPDPGYIEGVRRLCDDANMLLIVDEVQTGMGRTGRLWAYEHEGIRPDIITLAKALGNGIPIGAMGCTESVASGFSVGSHATTFGGNPVSCAAALATLTEITKPGFLDRVRGVGGYMLEQLNALAKQHDVVREARGRGLMLGLELDEPVAPVVDKMRRERIICGSAGPNVLRFLPPLIVSESEIDQAVTALDGALGEL